MRTLNLGILAHVDAGKTSLTERLLYAAGVIDAIGSVDDGTTQTDTLALERQRGITIKAAVASFSVGDVAVNLIDTPGHPDFIAEVERALCVLDGAVLVVSAVEGVQAQTRVLWRALARLRIPTLLFVNKIDRGGARPDAVLAAIAEKLSPAIVAMGAARDPGTRAAGFAAFGEADETFRARLVEQLAELDDRLLAAYVAGESPLAGRRLFRELARQTRRVRLHPVFLGSAITGAGVEALIAALPELLPARRGDTAGPLSAAVFKVERGAAGEKIAYVRVFSGTVHARDRLRLRDGEERKVTAIRAFAGRSEQRSESLAAGQIGKLWGLGDVRIGDPIGAPRAGADAHHFAPPTLETVVVPSRAQDRGALRTALAQLAEQDPLINLRQDDVRQELSLSLYGEVQKEVIAETLATEYGVRVEFRETTTLCIERPLGSGSAFEVIQKDANPFLATVGLRVARAAADSGVGYRLEVELGSLPYAFHKAVEETVRATLQQGLCGWEVTDCTVTMTHSGYSSPSSTAGDFRQLTPLVLMKALERAGTEVCEPIHRFRLEIPSGALGATLPILAGLRAVPESPVLRGATCALEGEIPAVRVHALRLQLASVTRGEGVLECAFERWRPVRGEPPSRARWGPDPLNRKEYLLQLSRRV